MRSSLVWPCHVFWDWVQAPGSEPIDSHKLVTAPVFPLCCTESHRELEQCRYKEQHRAQGNLCLFLKKYMSKITWPDFQCQVKCVTPKMSLEDGLADWTVRLYLMGNIKKKKSVKYLLTNGKRGEENWVVQNCRFPQRLFWVHLLDLYFCYWLSLRNLHRIT